MDEMESNTPLKYAFFILVAGTLLVCGCMESKSVSPEGEWIILPASEVWPEYSGYSSWSSTPTGDYRGLVITTVPDYTAVESGENVSIDVIFENRGVAPVVIDNFPPAFLMKDRADISIPSRIKRTYLRGDDTTTIQPGDRIVHTIDWDQRDNPGFLVGPGIYLLEITDVMQYDGETENVYRGSIGREITEITVRPAGGSLERSIVANQAVTNGTITITLESIHAKTDHVELVFSALADSPGYVAVMDDGREWTHVLSPEYEPLHGFYRIDDGMMRYLWKVESTGGQDYRYRYRCSIEPLPRDVQSITVTIDGFGPVPGLWDYHITL